MINDDNFFFDKIDSNFCYLLFGWLFRIFFKLSRHFVDTHFTYMIIIVVGVFGSINFLFVSFNKCNALSDKPVVPVDVELNGFFANFLNSLYQPIRVTVRVVIDNPHSTVDFSHFFPMWHFARTIVLNSFELIRVTVFSLKFVTTVFEKVSNFFYFYFLVVLSNNISCT